MLVLNLCVPYETYSICTDQKRMNRLNNLRFSSQQRYGAGQERGGVVLEEYKGYQVEIREL